MANYDFQCPNGHDVYEVSCPISQRTEPHPCPVCQAPGSRLISAPVTPTTIIVDYPGSKRLKAGYVHSHGDKMATKTQSGYGGMTQPIRRHLNPVADGVQPEPLVKHRT